MAELRDENGKVIGHVCYKDDLYTIDDELPEKKASKLSLFQIAKIFLRKLFRIK
jgi:hypothetical protein